MRTVGKRDVGRSQLTSATYGGEIAQYQPGSMLTVFTDTLAYHCEGNPN